MRHLLFIFAILFLIGCATTQYRSSAIYDFILVNCEKSNNEYTIIKNDRLTLEDENILIRWNPDAHHLNFTLLNKTDKTIKIIWDNSVYIDENGISNRVIHSGIKYIEKDRPQMPSIIIKNGTISDYLYPSNKIYFLPGQFGGWFEKPLFPSYTISKNIDMRSETETYIGKEIKILLALEINNEEIEYIFTLKINDITIQESEVPLF